MLIDTRRRRRRSSGQPRNLSLAEQQKLPAEGKEIVAGSMPRARSGRSGGRHRAKPRMRGTNSILYPVSTRVASAEEIDALLGPRGAPSSGGAA